MHVPTALGNNHTILSGEGVRGSPWMFQSLTSVGLERNITKRGCRGCSALESGGKICLCIVSFSFSSVVLYAQ